MGGGGHLRELTLIAGELLLRRLFWSVPGLRDWRRRRLRRVPVTPQRCELPALRGFLQDLGLRNGALAMVHSRVTGVHLGAPGKPHAGSALDTAGVLLDELTSLAGDSGTLVMPTNAVYQASLAERTEGDTPVTYNPARTPCAVGLMNELFWRRPGVLRSRFPYNMLAASGPLASELMRDNLNDRMPSPHGADSGYFRLCQRDGVVISIGLPLRECITIAHVVEEVRPDWPIPDFFMTRRFRVVEGQEAREWVVRLRREKYAQFHYCRKKLGRDLVRAGVIHEGQVGSLRVDWASSAEVFKFFWDRSEGSPYPYYGLGSRGRRPAAPVQHSPFSGT
jgi:aminoglycoside N3'-acetyltransferase